MNSFSFTHWIVLGIVSVFLLFVSWRSFQNIRSHGFYRFFAWETILILFLRNAQFWFADPLAWNQLIAWILLFLSLIPLGLGVHALRSQGNVARQREGDPSLLAFENTTVLVTSGIYRYIRHPLYSSLLLLTWGIFFKSVSLLTGVLGALSTILLLLTARADEAECIRFFGADYRQYMNQTKQFVPYVF